MPAIRPRALGFVLLSAFLWWSLGQQAVAQRNRGGGQSLPQPTLQSLFPTGVTLGGTTELTLRGTDLEGVTSLWFDHPGLRAFHVKGLTFRVVAATGTPPGYHDVRAVGTYGLSNPRTIVVGSRPEGVEIEPNNLLAQACPIAINSVMNGEIGPADVDHFVFEGKRGTRLRLDLEAERIDSKLDATLRVLDGEGRELAESRDGVGADPSLDFIVPADGRYVVKVHDVLYRGSNDYPYRLSIHEGPWIEAVVPRVLRPGEATTVTLYGQNLGGEPSPENTIEGRVLERKTVTINAPEARDADPDDPTLTHVGSAAAGRRGFEYVFSGPNGRSNPVFLNLASDPLAWEREPNDGESVQEVTIPCEVDGRFERRGDLDVYRFTAKKGQVVWVEVTAERMGSPADPVFVIQKVGDKGVTSDLTTGDDLPDAGAQSRFMTATVDAALRWSAPEDGLYQVAISDLHASQRGDVRLAYRLNLRPERPDFRLFVLPESLNQPDALTIRAGGRALAYVFAQRLDGFNGPVRVEAVELPPGVLCPPVTIPPDQSVAPIVFEASGDAKPVLGTVRLLGRGRFGDRKEELAYLSGATRLGPDVHHLARTGGVVWTGDKPNTATARLTRGFALSVIGPSPLTLDAGPAIVQSIPGGQFSVDLKATRREGFEDAVAISLVNPPRGMPAPPPTASIAKGTDSVTFTFALPKTLTPGIYSLVLQGGGAYPFSKDPAAKSKPNLTLGEPSNPVTLIVRPRPATVVLNSVAQRASGLTVKAGDSTEFELKVEPTAAGTGPISVSLSAPPALKLSAEVVEAPAVKPFKFVIKADRESPPGAAIGVSVRVSIVVRGESIEVVEPLVLKITN